MIRGGLLYDYKTEDIQATLFFISNAFFSSASVLLNFYIN